MGAGYLDALIYGIRKIFLNGVEQPTQTDINFTGGGVAITNDTINGRLNIAISGTGGGGSDATSIRGFPITTADSWTDGDALVYAEEAGEFEARHMTEMVSVPTGARLAKWTSGGLPARVTNTIGTEDASGNFFDTTFFSGTTGLSPMMPTLGNLDLSLTPPGAFVGVSTLTSSLRGFNIWQINSGAQSARVHLYKAEGTPGALVVPTTDGRGIGRVGAFAWDGTIITDVGFVDWEVATRYNSDHGSGGVISGTLPAVRCLIKSEGPVFAANNAGTSVLVTPLSHTWYFNGTITTPGTATASLSSVVMSCPILANTSTVLGVHVVGVDQTNGDTYHRTLQLGVRRITTGTPTLYASNPLADIQVVKDDATWAFTYAIDSGLNSVKFTITSDATNSVKWAVYVYELAVPFPA